MSQLLRIPLLALLLTVAVALQAQDLEFPELTGRVVDRAELLDPDTESRLDQKLAAHEAATSEQLVVATVPDLQGASIEQYGYQLGRQWGIGQAEKDNGALLIVAPNERKMRIEVGYGLEGRLTDAQSSVIINQVLAPAFRQGDYALGISEGVDSMIKVLGGDPMSTTSRTSARGQEQDKRSSPLFIVMFIIVMMLVRGGRGGLLAGMLLGGGMGGGGSRGGGGGGGFSGGGGGFGGGGASGGW